MERLNLLTVVKRSSTGLGLFAAANISKQTRIIQYTGKKISNDDAEQHKGKYLFALDDEFTIDGRNRDNLARYINHSCRPNADAEVIESEIWIVAKRKISSGEEITINYGDSYFDQFIKPKGCQCQKCQL